LTLLCDDVIPEIKDGRHILAMLAIYYHTFLAQLFLTRGVDMVIT